MKCTDCFDSVLYAMPQRIKRILGNPDMPLQIIFAGKAHPADRPGQEIIKNIVDVSNIEDIKRFKSDYR